MRLSQHLVITRNYIKGVCSLPDIDPSALDTGFISKQEFQINLRRVLFQKPNERGKIASCGWQSFTSNRREVDVTKIVDITCILLIVTVRFMP